MSLPSIVNEKCCTTQVLSMLSDMKTPSPRQTNRRLVKQKQSSNYSDTNNLPSVNDSSCCTTRVLSLLEKAGTHSPRRQFKQKRDISSECGTIRVLGMLDRNASQHSPRRRSQYNVSKSQSENSRRNITLMLVGLDGAGKTTIHNALRGHTKKSVKPTVGFTRPFILNQGNYLCKLYDLGGSSTFRSVWENYYAETHGFLFVIDSSDPTRLHEACKELYTLSTHPLASGKPLIVIANKQDQPSSISLSKLISEIRLICKDTVYVDQSINKGENQSNESSPKVIKCIASATHFANNVTNKEVKTQLFDPTITNGIDWVRQQIHNVYTKLHDRVTNDVAKAHAEEQKKFKERSERVAEAKRKRTESLQREDKLDAIGVESSNVIRDEQGKKVICLQCNARVATTKSIASAWRPVCNECNSILVEKYKNTKCVPCSRCGKPATKKSASLNWKPSCDACDKSAQLQGKRKINTVVASSDVNNSTSNANNSTSNVNNSTSNVNNSTSDVNNITSSKDGMTVRSSSSRGDICLDGTAPAPPPSRPLSRDTKALALSLGEGYGTLRANNSTLENSFVEGMGVSPAAVWNFSTSNAAMAAADAANAASIVLTMVSRMAAEMADSVAGVVGVGSSSLPVGGSAGLLSSRRSGRKSPMLQSMYYPSSFTNSRAFPKSKQRIHTHSFKRHGGKEMHYNSGSSRTKRQRGRRRRSKSPLRRISSETSIFGNKNSQYGRLANANPNLGYKTSLHQQHRNRSKSRDAYRKRSRSRDTHRSSSRDTYGKRSHSRDTHRSNSRDTYRKRSHSRDTHRSNSRDTYRKRSHSRDTYRKRSRSRDSRDSERSQNQVPANPNDWTYDDLSKEMDNLLSIHPMTNTKSRLLPNAISKTTTKRQQSIRQTNSNNISPKTVATKKITPRIPEISSTMKNPGNKKTKIIWTLQEKNTHSAVSTKTKIKKSGISSSTNEQLPLPHVNEFK